jgi:DNA-binding NarL/FixJ family response regulator
MTGPIKRILIADDHDTVRRGVRSLLESRRDLEIVAEAATGRDALAAARATGPDIAILDYSLPELNGHELTIALKRELPRIEVLIYTMYDRESLILDVLEAGARGFVLKSETEKHLFAAIDALAVHRPYFSSGVSETLLDQFLGNRRHAPSSSLTRRERQIVQLIAEGRINREIADLLEISVKTVETHRATAMHKLKLRTTADLVRFAVRNNIVEA